MDRRKNGSCAGDPVPRGLPPARKRSAEQTPPMSPRKRLYLRELAGSAWDIAQRRRSVFLDLSDPKWEPLIDYHRAVAPNAPLQDTIANLLLQALADDREVEAIRQVSEQAFKEVRSLVWTEIAAALRTIGRTLDLAPAGGENFGPGVTNLMITEEGDRSNGHA